MDIFKQIHSEHQIVKKLAKQIIKENDNITMSAQISELGDALRKHMNAEEKIFYKYLLQNSDKNGLIYEALEEHLAVRAVLLDIESTASENERLPSKMKVLDKLLKLHIEEEEKTIFPEAKKFINAKQAKEMNKEFNDAKKDNPTTDLEETPI